MRKTQVVGTVVLASLAWASAASAQPAPGPEPTPTASAQAFVAPVRQFVRIDASLPSAPLSRIVCTFSTTRHSLHPTVEWSARSADGLVRTVTLDGQITDWTVQCAGDPFKRETDDKNLTEWKPCEPVAAIPAAPSPGGAAPAGAAPRDATHALAASVAVSLCQRPDVANAPGPSGSVLTVGFAARDVTAANSGWLTSLPAAFSTTAGQRSFEGVGEIAAEFLQVIAEIAMERARAGAFNLVRGVVEDAACSEALRDHLAETCSAIKTLRMQDLSSTVTVLRDALLRDLSRFAFSKLEGRGLLAASDAALVAYLGRSLIDGAMSGSLEMNAHELLTEVAAGWTPACTATAPTPGESGRCVLGSAAELALLCSQTAYTCSVDQVMELAQVRLAGLFGKLTADQRDLIRFVASAALAKQAEEPRARVRRVFDAGFGALRIMNGCGATSAPAPAGAPGPAPAPPADGQAASGNGGVCKVVRSTQQMVVALLAEDLAGAISSGASVLEGALALPCKGKTGNEADVCEQHEASLFKVTRVAGTVAAYAATFKNKPTNEEERTAQHEARKELIADLVDAMTQRAERGGETVVSLGLLPGFFAGGQFLFCGSMKATTDGEQCEAGVEGALPQLALALGVTVQGLPKSDRVVGWHLGARVLDLGQFVALRDDGVVSKPTWATVFSPGIQFGMLLGEPDSNVFIGADVRVAPGLFSQESDPTDGTAGAIRFGGTIAYYVPFLDLN